MADGMRVQELSARFFTGTRLNRKKSDAAGRPIYDDVEMVEVHFPGDKHTVLTAPAVEETMHDGEMMPYYRRFAEAYEAFKAGDADYVDGTKVEDVGFLTEGQKRELRAINVRTVEQLAGMQGRAMFRLGPQGPEMRDKAEAFLERQEGGKAAQEADDLRRRVAELEAQLKAAPDAPVPTPAGDPELVEAYDGPVEDKPQGTPEPVDVLDHLSDAELKDYIRDLTGERPKGNPSRETLLRMVEEAQSQ